MDLDRLIERIQSEIQSKRIGQDFDSARDAKVLETDLNRAAPKRRHALHTPTPPLLNGLSQPSAIRRRSPQKPWSAFLDVGRLQLSIILH